MVVSLTYKTLLRQVLFPVYALPNEDYYVRDGLLFLDELVVDDRNQPGDTLGKRRLQTPHKLKKLSKAYSEYFDLLKENPPIMIDSRGKIFSYKKTEWHTVRSVKIKRKELKNTHTRIWCEKINFPFLINQPYHGKMWASVLYLRGNKPWILYDLTEERQEDSKRKI
jgi:hypothetical protein